MSFQPPVPIDPTQIPEATQRGGRTSNEPAIKEWLNQLVPGNTYELLSSDADGGHPVNRVTQIRKIAGEGFKVETRPIESGKRYRVFVTVAS